MNKSFFTWFSGKIILSITSSPIWYCWWSTRWLSTSPLVYGFDLWFWNDKLIDWININTFTNHPFSFILYFIYSLIELLCELCLFLFLLPFHSIIQWSLWLPHNTFDLLIFIFWFFLTWFFLSNFLFWLCQTKLSWSS